MANASTRITQSITFAGINSIINYTIAQKKRKFLKMYNKQDGATMSTEELALSETYNDDIDQYFFV